MPYDTESQLIDNDTVVIFGGEVKALGDGHVGGYLVRFGSPTQTDLERDYFDQATDFGIVTGAKTPVYLNHRLPLETKDGRQVVVREKIGEGTLTMDSEGVLIDAILYNRKRYERVLKEMGWSAGTASHLVDREPVGKSYHIKSWPLGLDASLTPMPAEPRNAAITLKALKAATVKLEALPQDAGDASEQGDASREQPNVIHSDKEIPAMGEKTLDDLATVVGQLATAVGEMKAKIDAPPVGNPGAGSSPLKGIEVKDNEDPKPFKSLGEQLSAVVKHATNRGHDARLDQVQAKAVKASGMNEGVGSEGGFALQNDFTTALLDHLYQPTDPMAIINRMTRQPIGPGANGFTAVMIDETSRATTRRGGMLGYWLPEGGTKTASKPALRQFELKLGKVTVLSYLTDELIQDVAALEAMVNREAPAELQFQVEDAGVNGNGAGKPLGVLASPCLVTVAKEANQPAATILYENIIKMWSRMPGRNRANAAWFINQDIEPQLFSMSLAVGTGGAPAYLPANGLSQQPYGTLFGRPVIPVEYCPTLGTVGDIIFADWSEYMLIDKGGVQSASSIHVQFLTDETVLRFVYRVNGAPMWNAPLTPFKGSNTLSPFVALATR